MAKFKFPRSIERVLKIPFYFNALIELTFSELSKSLKRIGIQFIKKNGGLLDKKRRHRREDLPKEKMERKFRVLRTAICRPVKERRPEWVFEDDDGPYLPIVRKIRSDHSHYWEKPHWHHRRLRREVLSPIMTVDRLRLRDSLNYGCNLISATA